jgi:hypothetical protein
MTNKQNAKLNMSQRISNTLDAHLGVYLEFTPLTSAVSEFQQIIEDIRTVATEQFSIIVPVFTQEKSKAQNKMIDVSMCVANALHVVGLETDNKVLINLLGLRITGFTNLTDNAKLTQAQRLYALAQEHSAELVNYGYDEQKISEVGQTLSDYKNLISKPMNAITTHKQKTSNLKELFVMLEKVLCEKLDKLIVLFKSSHPDFYGEYRTSRNLIFSSVRHKQEGK